MALSKQKIMQYVSDNRSCEGFILTFSNGVSDFYEASEIFQAPTIKGVVKIEGSN